MTQQSAGRDPVDFELIAGAAYTVVGREKATEIFAEYDRLVVRESGRDPNAMTREEELDDLSDWGRDPVDVGPARFRERVIRLMRHQDWCEYGTTGMCACEAGQALIDLLADERQAAAATERRRVVERIAYGLHDWYRSEHHRGSIEQIPAADCATCQVGAAEIARAILDEVTTP